MSAVLDRDLATQADRGDTYIGALLLPSARNEVIERALGRLRAPDAPEFDAIAITGVSGIVGALLAFTLDKPLIVVRKAPDMERSHSSAMVEGPETRCRVLMVDDFVRTGDTLARMQQLLTPRHTVVGVLLYRDYLQNPNICGRYTDGMRSVRSAVIRTASWIGCGFPDADAIDACFERVRNSPEVSNL